MTIRCFPQAVAVLLTLAGCSNEQLPTEGVRQDPIPAQATRFEMSRGQTARAIAARSKQAMSSATQRRESLIRKYDRNGRLLEERVWVPSHSAFVKRAGTIDAKLLAQPLSTFIPGSGTSIDGSQQHTALLAPPAILTYAFSAPWDGGTVTVADTGLSESTGSWSLYSRAASIDSLSGGGFILWEDEAGFGDLGSALNGDIVIADPYSAGFVEVVFDDEEWSDIQSHWPSDSATALAEGSLRSSVPQSLMLRPGTEQALMEQQQPCAVAKRNYKLAAGRALFFGAGALLFAFAGPSGAPAAYVFGNSAIASVGLAGSYYKAMALACGL